jgi:hypothetical protein
MGVDIIELQAPAPEPGNISEGKFLQLRLDDTEYLLFAPQQRHRYHNQILAEFLQQRGIEHHWATPERLEVSSARVDVLGGGRFRVDEREGLLELWDDSHAYGRFQEQDLKKRISQSQHPWSRYRVHIH